MSRDYDPIDEVPDAMLDPKIRNLVRALAKWGIDTVGSCEGHMDDPDRHPYPWVTYRPPALLLCGFPDAYWPLAAVKHFVRKYNQTHAVEWSFSDYEMQPMRKAPLEVLQESAEELAHFLLESYEARECLDAEKVTPSKDRYIDFFGTDKQRRSRAKKDGHRAKFGQL